ncbi:exopolyphosphatase [Kushneria phosphatilytica]|uniref:Exopolyphosphatase n=1 Tax=Kushneria phosphatilytica TaxID=657387 RepID=A0A142G9M9_9GAMM|nr:exopolyphosphatase [Kushneria phosphatilytica]AMR00666.1 exopolyphosphatase [Kushneria phosphatilytica]OHV10486.1 exopolyphosphatase [Kushneria phosphatilytica]QEL11961.1 exopolyphosphatase [Kushneria phosphatilytica]
MVASSPHPTPRRLAAVDLGSNSFHLLIADYVDGRLRVLDRRSDKVQLAAGLDDEGYLGEEAIERALACLERFSTLLSGIAARDMRIVGTNALRSASNSDQFIDQAQQRLGHTIEIIAGREEARLIYLGAAHALAEVHGRRLIVDIGGGSTELIIGEDFDPLALESLTMGCVSYTRRFFGDGRISEQSMRRAEKEALSELGNIQQPYRRLGWEDPIGTSGTIKAIAAVIEADDPNSRGMITRKGLGKLRQRLVDCASLEQVRMKGLKDDRARIFPAGVAILSAVFEALDIDRMRYASGALRDGVLLDFIGRDTPHDSRRLSVSQLENRFSVDARQADNVSQTVNQLFEQLRTPWGLEEEHATFLHWGARLHELGLTIAHSHFHKHGAYLVEHSDLAGFSTPEQRLLAWLVRAHRRRFPTRELERFPKAERCRAARLARLLRLAVVLNHGRPDTPPPSVTLSAEDERLHLTLDASRYSALVIDDLGREQSFQKSGGFELEVTVTGTE